MPRITGSSPSSSPIATRGNETPRNGNQGSSNTKHRSVLGSIGSALKSLGRSSKSSSSGSSSSASPPRGASPGGTPTRGQTTRAQIDTLRERGVDLQGLHDAIGEYISVNTPLPRHFRAALHDAGVDTNLRSSEALNLNHPLLKLTNDIKSELHPRRPAAAPPRPTGLTRSSGLRRTEGNASPPRAAQTAQAAQAHSPAREQTSRAPLDALNRAGIDPRAFNAAMQNFLTYGRALPANITAFLQNAGIPHQIDRMEGFGNHPLVAFDQQVRLALRAQAPAPTRPRPAGNTQARPTPPLRRPTPAPLDSADFDQSAMFAAPPRNVGAR